MEWLSFQSQPHRPAHIRREVFVTPNSLLFFIPLHFIFVVMKDRVTDDHERLNNLIDLRRVGRDLILREALVGSD